MNQILCADAVASFFGYFTLDVAPNLLFYSYIPIFLLSLIFSIYFYLRTHSIESICILLMTTSFCFWIILEIISWTAVSADLTMLAWQLAVIPDLIIYISVIYLVYYFNFKKHFSFYFNFSFFLITLIILFLTPTQLNYYNFNITNCEPQVGFVSTVLLPSFRLISLIAIIIVAVLSYRKQKLERSKSKNRQNIILNTATFLFVAVYGFSQVFGDFTNEYHINLIGPIGMLIFLVILAYIIVKFKAFNVKLIGAQALIIALWFLVGSLLFVAQSTQTRVIAGVTLIFTTIAGYFLVRSVKKEVAQREQIEGLVVDLNKANERLKILDKMKSEFVSIASHQLRSPLTSIRGYASMLVEGTYGKLPEKAVDVLKNISDSARFMAQSVEDYLNVSRIEAGNMKYELSDFSLKEQAEKIVDEMRQVVMKAGLVLLFRSENAGSMIVHADIGKTRQVINNIIDNAMKYTPHGTITVIAHDDIKQKKAIITIQDTGIGMDEDTQNGVFNKFVRAKNANSVNTSGTGLGLYVAKIMVEKMGGTVWAESEGQGKGSVFHIEFPLVSKNASVT